MYQKRLLLIISLVACLVAKAAATERIVPNALLTIDQNRPTVIERIVGEWGDRLASSSAGIPPAQLREILGGLRADALLAASLAGSLDGLRDVVATAMTSTAPLKPGRVSAMALGDTNVDLVYTPITPCRILDTRNGTIAPYNSVMVGGAAFPVTANLANFAPQGGSATSCTLPSIVPGHRRYVYRAEPELRCLPCGEQHQQLRHPDPIGGDGLQRQSRPCQYGDRAGGRNGEVLSSDCQHKSRRT